MQNAKHSGDISSKDIKKNHKRDHVLIPEDANLLFCRNVNFAASNNINLFEPIDHFDKRLSGEKNSASSQLSRLVFCPEEDPLLDFQYEDGQKKSQKEHVFIWPDIYFGTVEDAKDLMWGTQNFAASNNINMFEPVDQFGNRLASGKDIRYIRMSELSRLIFRREDNPLLEYKYKDGQKVEPVCYMPIIPLILVNQCEGIETGIPNYNPRDIIKNIRKMIAKEEPDIIHPWYKNFKGSIDYISDRRYITIGNLAIIGDNKIEITELPLGVSTQIYKENVLEPLLHGSDKIKPIIKEYKEYHTDTTVRFVCQIDPGEFKKIQAEGDFHLIFKLYSFLNLGRMRTLGINGFIVHYDSATEIMKELFTLRLEFYGKRKTYLESKVEALTDRLSEQARFIVEKGYKIIFESKTRKDAIDELIKKGYRSDPIKAWQSRYPNADDVETDIESNKLSDDYDYLLSIPIKMLTKEHKSELLTQKQLKLDELAAIRAKSAEMLWLEDLDELENKLNELEKQERLDERRAKSERRTKHKRLTKHGKAVNGDDQIFPSSNGKKVSFQVTGEILKKIEKNSKINAAGIKQKNLGLGIFEW